VGPTDDPSLSRITLTVDGALHPIDQVTKQLHKRLHVINDPRPRARETVARELALFKISTDGGRAVRSCSSRHLPRQGDRRLQASMTIEITGTDDKIRASSS